MNNVDKVRKESRPSTYWDQEELNNLRHKYLTNVKTVEQWYRFLQDNLHPMATHSSSSYPLDYTEIDHPVNIKDFTYKTIAEIKSFDVGSTLQKILNDNKDINANNSKVCADRAKNFSQELEFLSDKGFDKLPHVFNPTKDDYPEIFELMEKFNFDYYISQFRFQAPGSTQHAHTDSLDCLWGDLVNGNREMESESQNDITQVPFDPVTKCPRGYYAIRLLIPFTPYEPGHVFGFEDQYWTNWKQGDVITFDWAQLFHYTANCTFTPRVVLKITGITSNPNHWIFNAINNNSKRDL